MVGGCWRVSTTNMMDVSLPLLQHQWGEGIPVLSTNSSPHYFGNTLGLSDKSRDNIMGEVRALSL